MFVIPLSRPASIARPDARLASLNSVVDRLFDESVDRFFGGAKPGTATRTPAMDVAESDTAFTVTFEVPGVGREQLKVSVEGRRVALTTVAAAEAVTAPKAEGEPATATPQPATRVLYRERGAASYARTVSLPAEVDQASSQARFDNGVLTLVLAKKVPAGATELRIA